jgi:DGQHR domain-containing protein
LAKAKAKAKPKGRKPPSAEQLRKREERAFSRRIKNVFKNLGFRHLATEGKERKFGHKTGELDAVYLYENLIIVAEETTSKDAREHLKNKHLLFREISSNKADLVEWLREDFVEEFAAFDEYDPARYSLHFLYFTKNDLPLSEDDLLLFAGTRVVQPATFAYFQKMASNIRRSARADLFRFLNVQSSDVGVADSGDEHKTVSTSIIYPADNTGLKNGVRIVSFMMSAEMLLRNSFVLRKDNWEDSIELYQRLIERDRIQSIRRYLATKKTTFINNIIVSLPDQVSFTDGNGKVVDIASVASFAGHKMLIPDQFNSICVIDGQHRIFAHYEGDDGLEPEIGKLRKKFHLLVTGLIFPASMSALDRRKFESELFLDINSNARPVPADVLLFIETLKDPFSDLAVARQVVARMNASGPLEGRLQLSQMDDGKIRIASIIKYALRYLVAITDDPDRPSLFQHWSTPAKRVELANRDNPELLEEYVRDAAKSVGLIFSAVKATHKSDWDNDASRILSTTAINGFLIAVRRSLPELGLLSFDEYKSHFGRITTNFDRGVFPYTSSQYAKFSRAILAEGFDIAESSAAGGDAPAS